MAPSLFLFKIIPLRCRAFIDDYSLSRFEEDQRLLKHEIASLRSKVGKYVFYYLHFL